jgi:pantoate--beta-alanine ligase
MQRYWQNSKCQRRSIAREICGNGATKSETNMQIIQSKKELRKGIKNARRDGKTIGFVPTMGFLHRGHLSLIRRARKENDLVVVSIFVNPTQFGPNEDLDAYPRDAQRDIELMTAESVDIAFFPAVDALYPEGYTTFVEVEGPMTEVLCGQSRPTHFRGVTTIVAKLFNMVAPDRAYFGQKDAQQAAVIRRMAVDLDFDLSIVVCPIVREADGLAMSSRNTYLSPEQRENAPRLNQALIMSREMVEKGERSGPAIRRAIESKINGVKGAVIDYVAVVNAETLTEQQTLEGKVLIALAVKFGTTRLIDNIQIDVRRQLA